VPAAGLLANDSDPDGDALAAEVADLPGHGSLSLQADGSFLYTPEADYYGVDSFAYRVSDGVLVTGPVLVTITVEEEGDELRAVDDWAMTPQDTPVALDVLDNDEGVTGAVYVASVQETSDTGATVWLEGTGDVRVVPALNFVGQVTLTYTLLGLAGQTA